MLHHPLFTFNRIYVETIGPRSIICSALFYFPTFPSLHLRQSSFSKPSFASSTPQALHLIHLVSPAHSPTFPLLHLRHSSLSNPSFASSTSHALRLIHLASSAHFPTLPSLHLRHSSFSNPSVSSPTPQFILQPLFRFSYVTSSSLNSPGEPPMPYCILFIASPTLESEIFPFASYLSLPTSLLGELTSYQPTNKGVNKSKPAV